MIDLRSDTVTRPSPAMRDVIARASVGDDSYGEDPDVNALQEHIADVLGHEAALFVSSGTLANLCAILTHCGRGDEYLAGQMAHCYRWEGGGAAVLGGVQPQPLAQEANGIIPVASIRAAVKPHDDHFVRSRLLALENTFSGSVLPTEYIEAATAAARELNLKTHLDGARLFNAAVQQASDLSSSPYIEAKRIAQHFDSVSVCFSKGLGAPVGSALCGSKKFIRDARRIRRMCGGAMRQAGVLASAADFALSHHVADLARDHALAGRLAAGLQGISQLVVPAAQTNMVFAEIRPADTSVTTQHATTELLKYLRTRGILASGLYSLRFVAHRDVDSHDIDAALAAIHDFFRNHF